MNKSDIRILCVDDEPDILEILKYNLSNQGYNVDTAKDGDLAIKKALYITAHDKTYGSYIEFGVFTGSSFNFAMKANEKLARRASDPTQHAMR